jgi:fucose permease
MLKNNIENRTPQKSVKRAFIIAWIFGLTFYFLEYVIRSSPAVMITQLSVAFKANVLSVSTILGSYYYTYAITSLIAGVTLDRYGAKYPIAVGTGILSIGCILFALPDSIAGETGDFCREQAQLSHLPAAFTLHRTALLPVTLQQLSE